MQAASNRKSSGRKAFAVDKLPPIERKFRLRNRFSTEAVPGLMAWHGKQWVVGGFLAPLLLLAACTAVETRSADQFTVSGELIALSGGHAGASNACFTCHGLDGAGDGAGAPRLAGLDVGYLDSQLESYASGRRQHPVMQNIARRLAPEHRHAVAAYYAALPFERRPAPTIAPAPLLWVRGGPERGLPACASCHGDRGEGLGSANPPLAGQPSPYLAEQIRLWRLGKRRNDPGNVMQRISRLLTPRESEVLAAYAGQLLEDPRRLESRGASLEGRRGDSRNDVSARLPRAPAPAT